MTRLTHQLKAPLTRRTKNNVSTISSGSHRLNRALGIGGYPLGRMIEIYGRQSSGKTTLTLHAIAEAQRTGKTAAFVDAEYALNPSYAEDLGVDLNRLLIVRPHDGEQGLAIADKLIDSGVVELIVIDSVAALLPRAEADGKIGADHFGLHARLVSRALRPMVRKVNRSNTSVIFTNQVRQRLSTRWKNEEVTPGGHALKFVSAIRLNVSLIGTMQVRGRIIGHRTLVKVEKNKLNPILAEAQFGLRFGEGIDVLGELLEECSYLGLIQKCGLHYSIDDIHLGYGPEAARNCLLRRPDLTDKLRAQRLFLSG